MRKLRFLLFLVALAAVQMMTAQSEIMSYEKLDNKTGAASLNGMGGLAVYSELDNLSINITNAKDERVTKGLVENGVYEYRVTVNPNETPNGKVEINWGVERLTFVVPLRANFLSSYSVERVKHPIRLVDRTSDTDVYLDATSAQVEITSAVADIKVNVSPHLHAVIQTGMKDKATGITTTTITFPIKTLTDARGKFDDAERTYEAVDARLKQAEGKQLSQRQREQLVNEHRQAEKLMFASRDALAALAHISVYGNGSNVLDIDISSAHARSKFCWGVEPRESVSLSQQSSGSSRNTLTSQYVLFNLSPDNAVVELDGQMLETVDGTATKRMPFGTYTYRVQAPKHAPKTGSLTVSDPKNKHVVSVTLDPQFGNFTFTVADNAEIWIDEQLRGTGSCTVELGYGTYLVECRKTGHRPTNQEVVVSRDNAREKITLNPPTPIYGSLDINSAPANAEVWIDGKLVGTTPMFLTKYLAGYHEIKLKKQGYKDATMTANIDEGQTATVVKNLEKGMAVFLVSSSQPVKAVDLGLPSGTLWADRNVGADSPEDYGDYFAWGETEPKSTYSWSTYKWCSGSSKSMTKYCTDSSYGYNGFTDNKTTLELSDDVAYVNMGSKWRMPTGLEIQELQNKCTWTWTTLSGAYGYKITGPNGNSIFLPAAGVRINSDLDYAVGSLGCYLSSSLNEDIPNNAYRLYFGSDYRNLYDYRTRYDGRTVRAVVR